MSLNDFFSIHPEGFCLFILINQDSISVYGPSFTYSFSIKNLNDSILMNYISSVIRVPLLPAMESNSRICCPKPFIIFYASCCTKTNARSVAECFCKFFNEKVVINENNEAIIPQNLDIVYLEKNKQISEEHKINEFINLIMNVQKQPTPLTQPNTTNSSNVNIRPNTQKQNHLRWLWLGVGALVALPFLRLSFRR